MDAPETKSLPANAYAPLKPGEPYAPMVPAEAEVPEATWRSMAWGVFLCAIFTVASAYSGLKVGQVMEAAIPIAILAIGLARVYKRRSSLLENVIITSIGGSAGAVVAGAIFTLPALYILELDPHPWQTTFICLAGGCLGVLFLIPLRRYFVQEMHGHLPFPEATAITEVLVTGEKGGSQARLLIEATLIAGVYDFFVTTFQVWKEYVDFQFVPAMRQLAEQARVLVRFDAIAFILGLGYVMGLRSSLILCAGGFLSNFVLVPLIAMFGQHLPPETIVYPGATPLQAMSAGAIFRTYVRLIGVGAIATAGIFGILKSLRVVLGSFAIAARAFRTGQATLEQRTDRDLPVMTMLGGVLLVTLASAVFFGSLGAGWMWLLGLLLALGFSFFFASVAANAIATTARNPVSGMTMLTIIVSSVVLLRFGLSGQTGMFFVMAIAGMVCTALSVSGQTVTDLKAGYWLGSTPAVQQRVKFIGVITAALAAGLTIAILSRTFYFGEGPPGTPETQILQAPQAAIMKTLVQNFMSHQPVSWGLFGIGAVLAVVMEMLGAPALIFALGMYLPLELNTPALVGGMLSYWIQKRSERRAEAGGASIRERGIVIASGLMAGGALGGVFGAALRLLPSREAAAQSSWPWWWYAEERLQTPFFNIDHVSQLVSITAFIGLCAYVWLRSNHSARRAARG